MAQENNEFVTHLMESAIQLHELKMSLVNAGFSDAEAMQMIVALMQAPS
jgi:hypothetical protein